ncbi:MAG: hypothetical protein ACR2IS_07830 [Nitrososphaeraceae archaeon]
MEDYGVLNRVVVSLTLAAVIALLTVPGINNVFSQPISSMNNSMPAQQHANHTFDNLIVSEHIPLIGQLSSGDYILLMDFTPFVTSVEGHSHIALKVPCKENGSPKVSILTGIAPNLKTLNIGSTISNGTIDGNNIDLSVEGNSCLYHAELPNNVSDIVLANTSNQTLNFNEGGYYSVTVSAHGTATQHMSAPIS